MTSNPKSPNLNLGESIVVALGSNVSDGFASCEALLEAAVARFPGAGLPIVARSDWWRSAAWPDPDGPEYRNAVVLVEATKPPRELLETLFAIERSFGRTRAVANAARTLDLDLVAHGREVIDAPGLVIPHPRAHERLFVMGPLAQVAPAWIHPVLGATAAQLAGAATVGLDAAPC